MSKFPELRVVREAQAWMDAKVEHKLRSVSSFMVGEPTKYPKWLDTLIKKGPIPGCTPRPNPSRNDPDTLSMPFEMGL